MVEKIGLETILNMTNFTKGMTQYTKGISKMEGETGKAAGIMGKFDDIMGKVGGGLSGLIPGVAGATAAIYALKKSFEFAKEGAAIAQTEESFNRLIESIGAAPNTLDQMRLATRNTVDDLTLMSSTLTLVAGTTKEMSAAIVKASPELLDIAKAANKLNPTLGTTAQLYEQLAYGIKRSSPQRIDDLGLTIKLGEANARYAEKLGITVEQMSATDKQMALLEETLRAGDIMIQQVGGSTDSMTDSFAAAEVAIKNTTDELKKKAVPVWASFLNTLDATALGFEILGAALNGAIPLLDYFAIGAEASRIRTEEGAAAAREYVEAAIAAGGAANYAAYQMAKQDMDREVSRWNNYAEALRDAEAGAGGYADALEEVIVTTQDMAKVQKALEDVIAEVQKRYESFMRSLSTGIIKLRDLGDASEDSAARYQQALSDLAKEGTKSLKQVQDGFQASLPDATTVAERMGMAEDAWDEWGLRIQDIIEQGVESPWYAILQDMGYSKPPDVGMREWAEDLKQQFYAGQLPDLLPPEWAANVKAQQEEATRVVRAENAKRKQEIEDARQAELEAERQARNEATLELALTLAEQRGLLQAWSQERFGPDFSQVADTAAEVMGLLDAGMLDIDATLQGIIADSTAGVQTALDTTGSLAEENKKKLDELAETDYSKILSIDEIKQQWFGGVGEMFTYIEDEVPETPFDPILENFGNVSGDILNASLTMKLGLSSDFNEIDQLWAAMVLEQVKSWDVGMTDVETAIQEKVIDKLEEIPKRIVITVETETEGGTPPPRQHGGPVTAGVPYVVGEAGPELFIPDTPGQVMPNDWTMNLPALIGAGAGASTTVGPTVNLTMNPTINTPMDLAEFEMMTERTIQRAIRGY